MLSLDEIALVLGFSLGYLWGESFSQFDQAIKHRSAWFKELSPFKQWLAASTLDVFHHFQYGLALILLVSAYGFCLDPLLHTILVWAGWGLVASDWKDYQNVIKRLNAAKN